VAHRWAITPPTLRNGARDEVRMYVKAIGLHDLLEQTAT
jgi:hypothetical protein